MTPASSGTNAEPFLQRTSPSSLERSEWHHVFQSGSDLNWTFGHFIGACVYHSGGNFMAVFS